MESALTLHLDPHAVLPAELVAGKSHLVESIENDGFSNRYRLATPFGPLDFTGTGLLRKRIQELKVLTALEEAGVSADKVYLLSTANAARGPVEGAAQIVFHPVESVRDVPTGMWSYARRIVELAERDRTFQEDHYSEELIGSADAKRQWAYRLGVDVYSDNPLLQKTLERYAWISLTGGLTVRVPLMVVSGPAGYALSVAGTTDQMKRELRDRAPEEIRRGVRATLDEMGIEDEVAERFVSHPWYSPTRLLVIAESLKLLEEVRGRQSFVEVASLADEPEETYIFTRLAIMLAVCSEREAPIAELLAPNGLVMARTHEGDLVVPLYLDWARWTEPMSLFLDAVESSVPEAVRGRRALVSGWLSPPTLEQFESRGWQVDQGLEMTWLAEVDAAAWRPGEPDPDRVLPEFGR